MPAQTKPSQAKLVKHRQRRQLQAREGAGGRGGGCGRGRVHVLGRGGAGWSGGAVGWDGTAWAARRLGNFVVTLSPCYRETAPQTRNCLPPSPPLP